MALSAEPSFPLWLNSGRQFLTAGAGFFSLSLCLLSCARVYPHQNTYRKIAMQVHPDTKDGINSRDIFESATAAYGVLSDPGKKSTYDQARFGF